ncbi:MAG: glycosyl hydrolase [Candidatus Baltobacteraceae bacterium]
MKVVSGFCHAAVAVSLALSLAACGGGGKSSPSQGFIPSSQLRAAYGVNRIAPHFVAPLLPPAGTIYLGAYVNPGGRETVSQQIVSTAAFETSISRTLAIDMHYHQWSDPIIGLAEQDDATHGRIPLVSWHCADANLKTGVTDADVAAGKYDAAIARRAIAVRKFGHPIFLRYKWEFNLLYNKYCENPPHDYIDKWGKPHYSTADFIAAWIHIRQIFTANGATNVVWLWSPSGNGVAPSTYYPGDSQVDWIGLDWYDSFNLYFTDIYNMSHNENTHRDVSTYPYLSTTWPNKPLMISETGAVQNWQVSYFTGNASHLAADPSLQQNFPNVKAYVYWNSTGSRGNFQIGPALQTFKTFADLPYESGFQQ